MAILYVVSTPIGNMQDITLRALEVLKEADLILAEDTRQTGKLLTKYGIGRPMESFFEHNEERKIDSIISKLKSGLEIALVADSGTPTISDPGFKLVRKSIGEGISVIPVPGPNAVLTALVASGLATDKFIFLGYFPKKPGKQKEILEFIDKTLSMQPVTVIFFESPYRVKKTISILASRFPEKETVIARELTKKHEEFLRGKLKDLATKEFSTKGEFTILLR
ncbi:MAG: 16S rRNA (cytidine(1402)-2'-O)-methyltransferase [Candidatus Woykebacteria bacterium RBG_19FT_COMBO_43_10]|uniref:Ribosomal RNA small subunit methyltransferase I n=1 Tax=Candidatus Woykebacteria bacterium RBG_19FT_COMBO_43_10 TaxID=1802598 RepID=A0A1G1WIL6_9BACT|nr:MAG: 16S rRNA (cytidine(1402)-2'-O)-methyltransferase [Candidatus Woykebacteria bacterium RBG_19FT_COMBO_43_10]